MTDDIAQHPICVACGRTDHSVPLLAFSWRGEGSWVCSQHLPVLIHEPARLQGRLRGAEELRPADLHD